MAGSGEKASLRYPTNRSEKFSDQNPMRRGKTAEDKRIGAWASKSERNARQAALRERGGRKR